MYLLDNVPKCVSQGIEAIALDQPYTAASRALVSVTVHCPHLASGG